jgi:NAD(P)-dependent dehydrogenase (short-subunit alcohol dehydrogenase family)
MPYSLKSRTVLITGGSRGLGAVISARFAAEGANIAINYSSSEEPALKLAAELKEKYSVKAEVYKADAGSMAQVEELVKTVVKDFGGVDVIVGNAVRTRAGERIKPADGNRDTQSSQPSTT